MAMAIFGYDALAYYAAPPNSYIGTTIFLSYIIVALYATLSIINSLYTQYTATFHESTPTKDEKDEHLEAAKAARKRHIKIYAFLASISFAALSYHMLSFLVTHYFNWTDDKSRTFSTVSGTKLKKWMLDSTLFQDFATELVEDAPSAVWTQLAILQTWVWNIWIARKAREHRLTAPTMLPFILLSQILPISFTACLFIIQLHISASSTPPIPITKIRQIQASPLLPTILLNCSILALTRLRSSAVFMPLILFSRIILLLPHSGMISLRESSVRKCLVVTAGFFVALTVLGKRELWDGERKRVLREGGNAAKALGWDALLGGGVWGVLGWGGGV